MDAITYSLQEARGHSARYYQDIAAFAAEILAEAESRVGRLAEDYNRCRAGQDPLFKLSLAESAFELLTLGVLWRVYAENALALDEVSYRVFSWLVRVRERGGFLKPVADFFRRFANTRLLLSRRPESAVHLSPLEMLAKLMNWLQAAGEFSAAVKRLRAWQAYFHTLSPQAAEEHLAAILEMSAWFEARSLETLGSYTAGVERFLAKEHGKHRFREDFIFCGRRRVEYHLNMAGNQLLNQAFRENFLATARKVVILPPCMRARKEEACLARPTALGELCAGCTPGCRVNQLTRLGEKYGFAVLLMPGDLRVFSSDGLKAQGASGEKVGLAPTPPGTGLVGVSCVLTNAPGGWDVKEMGIPAQGMLLNYCGCSYHWDKDGIMTGLDMAHLLKVLGINKQD